jgi:hypothetical protein
MKPLVAVGAGSPVAKLVEIRAKTVPAVVGGGENTARCEIHPRSKGEP